MIRAILLDQKLQLIRFENYRVEVEPFQIMGRWVGKALPNVCARVISVIHSARI